MLWLSANVWSRCVINRRCAPTHCVSHVVSELINFSWIMTSQITCYANCAKKCNDARFAQRSRQWVPNSGTGYWEFPGAKCAANATITAEYSAWIHEHKRTHVKKSHLKNAHRIAHNMTNTFPLRTVQCKPVCFYWRVCTMRRCSVVIADRTPVFNWRTFPMPDLWWIGLYDHFEGKVSAIGQPTRPTQPFILPGR